MSMAEVTALVIGALACAHGSSQRSHSKPAHVQRLWRRDSCFTAWRRRAAACRRGPCLGLLAGLLVFFPFFALGAMGAGDVKLMAALGVWIGWQPVLQVALFGAVAGGVLAVGVALWRGYLRTALKNIGALLRFWSVVGHQAVARPDARSGNRPAPSRTPFQSWWVWW